MPLPEKELIARIGRSLWRPPRPVVKGIGDDCAIMRLPAGHEALITTDFSLEDVHFRRAWFPPESVGHRCAIRGLSDIAAMGGEPLAAFLSLALPVDLSQDWVDGFVYGFVRLIRSFKVHLAGGDTAQSPPCATAKSSARDRSRPGKSANSGRILADVILLGSVPRGQAVLRSGAQVGDDIYVTGDLGSSVAVLHRFMAAKAGQNRRPSLGELSPVKFFSPMPRIAVGRYLRKRGLASAMIDISDGLSTDLAHICKESKVGAWIAEPAVPVAEGATLYDALHGGDEYELLFTAPAARHDRIPDKIAGVPIRWIGTITKQRGMWLVNREMKQRRELKPLGWEHFGKIG